MQEVLQQIYDGLETLIIFSSLLGGLVLTNTLIGSINAWSWGEWKTKKFWNGLIKNLLIVLTMAMFYIVLELIPYAFAKANIIVPMDMVKGIELIGILAVSITKYVKDIYTGLLKLLNVTKQEVDDITGEQE